MDPWNTPTKNSDHFKQHYFSAVKEVSKYMIVATYTILTKLKNQTFVPNFRSSHPEVFLEKFVLKICNKIYRRTPMPKCNFNKITLQIALRHGCSPANVLHIFRKSFPKNTAARLLLQTL